MKELLFEMFSKLDFVAHIVIYVYVNNTNFESP